jgi:hypothetical protein
VSTLVAASPELKRLWIRVLKQVHPSLAADEQDRRRCERLTQQANDAYARRDELALRAVLEPKGPSPRNVLSDDWEVRVNAQPATPPESTYQPPLVRQQPPTVIGRELFGILWAAGAVVCLLLYGIFNALSGMVGRGTSIFFLVLLTAAVLWLITQHAKLSHNQKAKWVAAVASGMILVAIFLLDSRPKANPLFSSARAATAQALAAPVAVKVSDHVAPAMNAHPAQSNTPQTNATVMPPKPEPVASPDLPLSEYIEVAKKEVAQKWNGSEVAASTPAGATAYLQFVIRRDGKHGAPILETSSGYLSLDVSCLGAVDGIQTFGRLPRGYEGDSLTVVYHCSYPGSPTTKSAPDSIPPSTQQQPPSAPVDGVHGAQPPASGAVVNN